MLCTFPSSLLTGRAVKKPPLGWKFPNVVDLLAAVEGKAWIVQWWGQQFMVLCRVWQVFGRKRQSPEQLSPVRGVVRGAAVLCGAMRSSSRGRSDSHSARVLLTGSLCVTSCGCKNNLGGVGDEGCSPLEVL